MRIRYTKTNEIQKDEIEKTQEIELTDTKIDIKIPIPQNNTTFPLVQQSEEWLIKPVDENIIQQISN